MANNYTKTDGSTMNNRERYEYREQKRIDEITMLCNKSTSKENSIKEGVNLPDGEEFEDYAHTSEDL